MKVITYKQLCKEQSGTMFATLNKMNEMSEIFVIGRYPDDRKYLYSPLSDATNPANGEIEFDSNCFNRRDGTFIVFTKEEVEAYVFKLMNAVTSSASAWLETLQSAVQAQETVARVAQSQAVVLQAEEA